MWLFVMFDLPVVSKEDRRRYSRFRGGLLRLGFQQMQYSVYARYYPSEEAAATYRKRLRAMIPPHGQVRLLAVTDKQFGKMQCFTGKKEGPPEKPPDQLLLF